MAFVLISASILQRVGGRVGGQIQCPEIAGIGVHQPAEDREKFSTG
jgi:hypothetical protein